MSDDLAMGGAKKTLQIRGKRMPTFGSDFVVIRTGRFGRSKAAKPLESRAIINRAAKALSKPGIKKSAVFKGRETGVFAYSVDPSNPAKKIVRKSASGKRTVGRYVGGRFKAG
jgi:hypothetical protein